EVLGVNSVVDESRPILSVDEVARHQARLADLVTVSGSDLGALIDPLGERLFIVDDNGTMLDGVATLLLAASIVASEGADGTLAIPVHTSREVMERATGDRVELVDGVKTFYGEDWVLVLPDPEQPIVHVYAESDSDSKAHALDGRQARLVRSLVE